MISIEDNIQAISLILVIFFTLVGVMSKGVFWFLAAAVSMVVLAANIDRPEFTAITVFAVVGLLGAALGLNKTK